MKKRTISAAIMILIAAPLIILGKIPFALGIGLISIFAFREIIKLHNYPLIVKLLSFIGMITIVYSNFDSKNIINGLDYRVLGLSLLLILLPAIIYQTKNKYTTDDAFKLYGLVLLVGLGLNFFIIIRDLDLKYFLYIILNTIFTDTFAYIGGSLIGKHKFTSISPKKTIEGCIVGSLMGTVLMTIFYTTLISNNNVLLIILISLLISIMGQIGDLFFSAIKRNHNIKDFSNLIPGHGGVLDRLDSAIFASIIFMVLLRYL